MTHNLTADKRSALDRRAFLGALYQGCPDDLYMELRCIHPETGEVKTFWSKLGDKRRLTSNFKQADALNRDGIGLYFAPCLRSESKGSAESAALVPALWLDVDTDGDPAFHNPVYVVVLIKDAALSVWADGRPIIEEWELENELPDVEYADPVATVVNPEFGCVMTELWAYGF